MSKMSYDTAMKVLKKQFQALKQSVEKNNLSSAWVDEKPRLTKNPFLIKTDKTVYGIRFNSKCENFEGYYITDGYGGVKCALVSSPLPGTVYDINCSKENCDECPISVNRGLALRDKADEFLQNLN